MDLKAYLEKNVSADFELSEWIDRLIRAKAARNGWDAACEICDRIQANDIPILDKDNALKDFTDRYYSDNWIMKSCQWLISYLMGSDITIDLKGIGGADDMYPDREPLEMEVNYANAEFELLRKCYRVISDRVWRGYGVSYMQWNNKRINAIWQTGQPEFRAYDAKRYWVDYNSGEPGWSDRNFEFLLEQYPVKTAKKLFPEHAKIISETYANETNGDKTYKHDMFDVYLCQFKELMTYDVVDVVYSEDTDGKIFKRREQVYVEDIREYLERHQNSELPENIFIGEPYQVESWEWFQFMFSFDLNLRLTEIEHIGKRDHIQVFWGLPSGIDNYPRSWAYFLKDLQDIKAIVMTLAAVQACKNGREIPLIKENAMKNVQNFLENYDSLGAYGIVNEEWSLMHPNEKAVDTIAFRTDPQVTMLLNSLITDAIKTSTGSIDTARGEAQYSGMSGVMTAQLQAAATIYTKQDEIMYRQYLRDMYELLLQFMGEYRTYEHYLEGVNEFGERETMLMNAGGIVSWNWERYYCQPVLENNPEMVKQIRENRAVQLNSAGKLSTVDMLRELGYANAEKMWSNALNEAQILQAATFLQQNPQVLEAILSGVGDLTGSDRQNNKSNSKGNLEGA
jgi:hypothetical protein